MITLRFVIASQKNTAAMTNTMPQMQAIQAKITDARKRGDMYDSAKYSMEMQKYSKESGINPLKSVMPLFVQMPFFMGMFMGLRSMAQLPVARYYLFDCFLVSAFNCTEPTYLSKLSFLFN